MTAALSCLREMVAPNSLLVNVLESEQHLNQPVHHFYLVEHFLETTRTGQQCLQCTTLEHNINTLKTTRMGKQSLQCTTLEHNTNTLKTTRMGKQCLQCTILKENTNTLKTTCMGQKCLQCTTLKKTQTH